MSSTVATLEQASDADRRKAPKGDHSNSGLRNGSSTVDLVSSGASVAASTGGGIPLHSPKPSRKSHSAADSAVTSQLLSAGAPELGSDAVSNDSATAQPFSRLSAAVANAQQQQQQQQSGAVGSPSMVPPRTTSAPPALDAGDLFVWGDSFASDSFASPFLSDIRLQQGYREFYENYSGDRSRLPLPIEYGVQHLSSETQSSLFPFPRGTPPAASPQFGRRMAARAPQPPQHESGGFSGLGAAENPSALVASLTLSGSGSHSPASSPRARRPSLDSAMRVGYLGHASALSAAVAAHEASGSTPASRQSGAEPASPLINPIPRRHSAKSLAEPPLPDLGSDSESSLGLASSDDLHSLLEEGRSQAYQGPVNHALSRYLWHRQEDDPSAQQAPPSSGLSVDTQQASAHHHQLHATLSPTAASLGGRRSPLSPDQMPVGHSRPAQQQSQPQQLQHSLPHQQQAQQLSAQHHAASHHLGGGGGGAPLPAHYTQSNGPFDPRQFGAYQQQEQQQQQAAAAAQFAAAAAAAAANGQPMFQMPHDGFTQAHAAAVAAAQAQYIHPSYRQEYAAAAAAAAAAQSAYNQYGAIPNHQLLASMSQMSLSPHMAAQLHALQQQQLHLHMQLQQQQQQQQQLYMQQPGSPQPQHLLDPSALSPTLSHDPAVNAAMHAAAAARAAAVAATIPQGASTPPPGAGSPYGSYASAMAHAHGLGQVTAAHAPPPAGHSMVPPPVLPDSPEWGRARPGKGGSGVQQQPSHGEHGGSSQQQHQHHRGKHQHQHQHHGGASGSHQRGGVSGGVGNGGGSLTGGSLSDSNDPALSDEAADAAMASRFADKTIEEVVGSVFALCRDQYGCRFLQKKLDEHDTKALNIIFEETHERFAELMTDPFGNYLCQKLLEHCDAEQRLVLIRNVSSQLVRISTNMHGTRAVQKMIEFVSTPEQVELVKLALQDNVVTLIQDLNGNHVVQRCLHRLTHGDNQFIYDAVAKHCIAVATHRHGCCVLQRCIDHANESQKKQLVDTIERLSLRLVRDPYGNYVVQYMLDLPYQNTADKVCSRFRGNLRDLSTEKFSSNVIEKCLKVCNDQTREWMIDEVMGEDTLSVLLQDAYGNYVVQTSLNVSSPSQHRRLVDAIRPHLPQLRNTPYGKRIQNKIMKELSTPSGGSGGGSSGGGGGGGGRQHRDRGDRGDRGDRNDHRHHRSNNRRYF